MSITLEALEAQIRKDQEGAMMAVANEFNCVLMIRTSAIKRMSTSQSFAQLPNDDDAGAGVGAAAASVVASSEHKPITVKMKMSNRPPFDNVAAIDPIFGKYENGKFVGVIQSLAALKKKDPKFDEQAHRVSARELKSWCAQGKLKYDQARECFIYPKGLYSSDPWASSVSFKLKATDQSRTDFIAWNSNVDDDASYELHYCHASGDENYKPAMVLRYDGRVLRRDIDAFAITFPKKDKDSPQHQVYNTSDPLQAAALREAYNSAYGAVLGNLPETDVLQTIDGEELRLSQLGAISAHELRVIMALNKRLGAVYFKHGPENNNPYPTSVAPTDQISIIEPNKASDFQMREMPATLPSLLGNKQQAVRRHQNWQGWNDFALPPAMFQPTTASAPEIRREGSSSGMLARLRAGLSSMHLHLPSFRQTRTSAPGPLGIPLSTRDVGGMGDDVAEERNPNVVVSERSASRFSSWCSWCGRSSSRVEPVESERLTVPPPKIGW